VNGAARLFERCSKQSRQLATRAISANSQADFHQHVIKQTVRGPCATGVAKPAITSIAFSNFPLVWDSLICSR
jgi:hypothetical protein